jgi:hypothetical protein
VYAKRLVLVGPEGLAARRTSKYSLIEMAKQTSPLADDSVDGAKYQASLRFRRGVGGLRMEFMLRVFDGLESQPPHPFVTIALAPTQIENGEFLPPRVRVLDSSDRLLATVPSYKDCERRRRLPALPRCSVCDYPASLLDAEFGSPVRSSSRG